MDATVLLSASHWGNHHHLDSLNLTYHRWGEELLGDLGYLWDNPMAHMTRRTAAHNLVVVDEQEQRTRERGGAFRFFQVGLHTQMAEAESRAYAQCDLYRRAVVTVTHGERDHYVVDIFRVQGGDRHDYLFHGPNDHFAVEGMGLEKAAALEAPYELQNLRVGEPEGTWRAVWTMGEGRRFVAWMLSSSDETVLWGDGWGQKGGSRVQPDPSITLPYVIRRRQAEGTLSVFASVFAAEESEGIVQSAILIPLNEEGAVAVRVKTPLSVDYVISRMQTESLSISLEGHSLALTKPLVVISFRQGRPQWIETAP
jgi:hypothetical protein